MSDDSLVAAEEAPGRQEDPSPDPAAAESAAQTAQQPGSRPEPAPAAADTVEPEPAPAATTDTVEPEPAAAGTETETVQAATEAEPALATTEPQPGHEVRPEPGARPRPDGAPSGSSSPTAADLLRGAVTFGRVDADGTVYVRTTAGDRLVGQFPDSAPNEALVYYVRKFEELVGQVDLFAQRLRAGAMKPKDARGGLDRLRQAVAEPAAVGDVDGLQRWVDGLGSELDRRAREADARRAAARATALTEREAIVAEAERLAATPTEQLHFKSAMERVRGIVEEWKAHQKAGPRLDKAAEDKLWQRLSAARSTVDKARRQHIHEVAEQRTATRTAKEKIITEAEELAGSTDWRATSDALRRLMDRWKAAGRLARGEDDQLWARFRAAQDRFYAARTAAMAEQDEQYRGNLAVKEQLLTEAEALLPITDLRSAKRRLRSIQDRWDAAGRVPRADLDRIERRLSAVADTIRKADQSRWTATNPEALARAQDVVSQLENGVSQLERELATAEANGDARAAERARSALETRRAWLDQARTALSDLGG